MIQSEPSTTGLRRPRELFTRTLERICKQLDDKPSAEITWKERMLWRELTCHFVLRSLWVVGSYARGAHHCGDLDLVAEIDVEQGYLPSRSQVVKSLFNCLRDVRMYIGTPSDNSSGIEFHEAILIWQGDARDWHKAIGDLKTSSDAVRFPRPLDRLPFRQEQLHCQIDQLEDILKLERAKIIRWSFTPLENVQPTEPEKEYEHQLIRVMNYHSGKKTQKLMPQLISYFRDLSLWPQPCLSQPFGPSYFRFGGTYVLIGRPEVPIGDLDEISTSRILVVPHKSTRGPNGFWMIERGERHPLVLALRDVEVFCMVDEEGEPIISSRFGDSEHFYTTSWTMAKQLDIFTSEKLALKRARQFNKSFEENIKVKVLNSQELLSCFSYLDAVYLDDTEYAIDRYGWRGDGSGVCKTHQELLTALKIR